MRGFRLAGVSGEVVVSPRETAAAIQAAAARPDCGIIILTEKVADGVRPVVEQFRFERERPLILEIPGPDAGTRERKNLRDLVQEAVGIQLDSEKAIK